MPPLPVDWWRKEMQETEDQMFDHIHEPQDPTEPTIADMSDKQVVAFAQKIKQFLADKKGSINGN